jgi:hypothetical protein
MVTKRPPVKSVRQDPKKDNIDKAIDLIKWVDNPFKLFAVVLLSIVFFAGYFAWDSRQTILTAIHQTNTIPKLRTQDEMLPVAQKLLKDLDAKTVVVNEVNLVTNLRTTLIAISQTERNSAMEGVSVTLISEIQGRNKSVVAMMAGEVDCEDYKPSSKIGGWVKNQGVDFVCRGSIPPPMGQFAGYVAVGFKGKPQDLNAVKIRINLASTQMAK